MQVEMSGGELKVGRYKEDGDEWKRVEVSGDGWKGEWRLVECRSVSQ